VRRCLANVESIEMDKDHWRLTARSLLALYDDPNRIEEAANDREQRRATAELTSRVVLEMAICTSPLSGAPPITESDFDGLLAGTDVMILAANYSDAIVYEMTPAEVFICPNGEFNVDASYGERIIHPFVSKGFHTQFHAAANSYDKNYESSRNEIGSEGGDHATDSSELGKGFRAAFLSEYGVSPECAADVASAIQVDGVKTGSLVVMRTESELLSILAEAGIGDTEARRVLNQFSLRPRSSWESTPKDYTAKDWHPWRYRRRLSLLARPFVAIQDGSTGMIVYAPALVGQAVLLLFERLLDGELPNEYFRSQTMRSWVGEVNRNIGRSFETLVRDEFTEAGLSARDGVSMHEFGANDSYGDLDVLVWDEQYATIYAVECKHLRIARTVAEIGEQLRSFKGEEGERMVRHLRRCQWLKDHSCELFRVIRASPRPHVVVPVLVTSTIVPMQFVENIASLGSEIVTFDDIAEFISRVRSSQPAPSK